MNVGCPQCSAIFRVDPTKVPAGGVRARCSICGGVIPVPEPTSVERAEATAALGARAPGSMSRISPAAGAPVYEIPPYAAMTAETHTPSGAWPQMTPSAPLSAMTPVSPGPAMPVESPLAPTAPPVKLPPQVPVEVDYAAMTWPAQTPTEGEAVTVKAPAAQATPAAGTHVNPYLVRDPHNRAKRLARALVSDIVTYYPDRHAEAMQQGTLKENFREEIKKSHQDYVAQVGAELADSTPYFQDALNEVLAGGKKIF